LSLLLKQALQSDGSNRSRRVLARNLNPPSRADSILNAKQGQLVGLDLR